MVAAQHIAHCPAPLDELAALPQWVVWGQQEPDGGRSKRPLNAHNGHYGSSTNPRDWGTYREAYDTYTQLGLAGVGLVLTEEDPYCGIDLDNCYDPATGTFTEAAAAIIKDLNSYTEFSPSGRGVHILVRADKPGAESVTTRRGTKVEVYHGGRYLSFTGWHVPGTPACIEERQAELTALYNRLFPLGGEATRAVLAAGGDGVDDDEAECLTDAEVLDLLGKEAEGAKWLALYDDGDLSAYDHDHSRADLALCSKLAFYAGPFRFSQVDRLFRGSALYRPKWDEMHGRGTYGEMTMRKVFYRQEQYFTPSGDCAALDDTKLRLVRTDVDLANLTPAVAQDPGTWAAPLPLRQAIQLPTFPTHALPAWGREYVESVSHTFQVAPDLAAMQFLAVVSASVAGKGEVEIWPGFVEPLNVYTVVALPPANRKSPVVGAMKQPLVDHEKAEMRRLAPQVLAAQAKRHALEKAMQRLERDLSEAGDGERAGLVAQLDSVAGQLASFRGVVEPRMLYGADATPEKMVNQLAKRRGQGAIFSDEAGALFAQMGGRHSGDGEPNYEIYIRGYDGREYTADRIGRESDRIERVTLTLGLAVQPGALRKLFAIQGAKDRGLPARFFYALPPSLIGQRQMRTQPVPPAVESAYRQGVAALLRLREYGEDEDGIPIPHRLVLSPEASDLMASLGADIERRMAGGGDLSGITDWAGKLLGGVGRLAGLLHLAEHHGQADPWAIPLGMETVRRAWAIGEYLIPHALAVMADEDVASMVAEAERLLRKARKLAEQGERVTRRNLQRSGGGKASDLDAPLDLLVRHGYLRPVGSPERRDGGRPSEGYEVNPLWLGQN